MTTSTESRSAVGVLQQLSDELAGAVETAGSSLVRINGRRRLPATGIVWSADAAGSLVVTASHVVERDEDITITTPDGRTLPVALAGRDGGSDIAVLLVAGEQLQPAAHAEGDARVGELVLALGRAGELAATIGVVSAYAGPAEGGRGPGYGRGRGRRSNRLISSDAPMFPGFSGGPLVNATGAVIGMVSSHLGRGQTLAVPVATVDQVAAALRAHGKVRRGYLGVGAQPVELPASLRAPLGLTQERGLLLVTVDESGPAGAAGLTIGDIVLSISGQPVEGLEGLRGILDGESVGKQAAVRFLRGGVSNEASIVVGEQS